jgi:ribonuclease P protein component
MRSGAGIARLRQQGLCRSKGAVSLWSLRTERSSRAAISVPARPLGHVQRNLARRRVRAVLDQILPPEGWDVMVGVRGSAPSYSELENALIDVFERSGITPQGARQETPRRVRGGVAG